MKPHKAARRRKRPVRTPPSLLPKTWFDRIAPYFFSIVILISLLLIGYSKAYKYATTHRAVWTYMLRHDIRFPHVWLMKKADRFRFPTREAVAQSGSQSSERIIYLHTDVSGRVIATSTQQGEFTRVPPAEPFGKPSNGNPEPTNLGFPGQYYDRETGLYYNNRRDYNPSTGRYLQPDPFAASPLDTLDTLDRYGVLPPSFRNVRRTMEFVAATRAAFDEPEGPSPYTYSNQNPERFQDPLGLFPQTPKDSISARIESLIGRGRVEELRDFLASQEEDFPPQVCEKLLRECRTIFERRVKTAQRAYRTNRKFRTFLHRDYKPGLPKGPLNNRNANPNELIEAYEEFFGVE
jgi:RHS repeat-associated protein